MSDTKAKIRGLGELLLSETPKPDTDYLITLRVALSKIEKDVEDTENPFYTYVLKYISTEEMTEELTQRKIKAETSKTYSKKIRDVLRLLA